ncbi:MAG TPA: NAD(P)H-dependent oxidoreductase [Ferrovibrio sp.]|uniref:flavodoxin family protein n=1 Tax=Ferrovibrio sp. TaxID=1917215 RepID=UPI002B4B18F5|nr:NAD(P)H-dependent oxidoreductase [Ferrovibrio sp.]HLT77879.1 NAD(P)H-dependent oxidoreductase [Ferrovibrio sp.]
MALTALALNCSLKSTAQAQQTSTSKLLDLFLEKFRAEGVTGEQLRMADFNIKPGVTSDEGPGDDWPELRRRLLEADILIMGTPIWLGQPSSIAKRVLERLDAFLSETDEQGRMVSFGRVAVVGVVGNEDGAHHVSAELYQALNDTGFTIAATAVSYWVGEAMQKTDFQDLPKTPDATDSAMLAAVRNAVHLAKFLKQNPYPPQK